MPLFDHTTTHEDLRRWCAYLCAIIDASESVSRWPPWANRQDMMSVERAARFLWHKNGDFDVRDVADVEKVIENTAEEYTKFHARMRAKNGS